jgi:hypothetical protein
MPMFFRVALIILSFTAVFFFGVTCAYSQLVPPPPAASMLTDSSFTAKDRAILHSIFRMTQAVHTRLFPLSMEQKLLQGGTLEVQP